MLSKKLAAVVAASVLTASSAAVAQTAQPLSLSNAPVRAGAVTSQASALDDRNGIGIYIIGAVVLGLIVWGVIELTSDDEGPSSP